MCVFPSYTMFNMVRNNIFNESYKKKKENDRKLAQNDRESCVVKSISEKFSIMDECRKIASKNCLDSNCECIYVGQMSLQTYIMKCVCLFLVFIMQRVWMKTVKWTFKTNIIFPNYCWFFGPFSINLRDRQPDDKNWAIKKVPKWQNK